MRPLRLVIRALGPYVSEQVLDFRELGPRTLLLVHGPTGSGKTTILDAITFALYGECSGGDREVKRMRSDHADPSLLTEVTFDFRLGGEEYRVYRRPEQQRPKKRAEGTTVARAKAVLSKRTGLRDDTDEGSIVASRWNDVTEAVEKLLGFRSDQFRQVVVLPQGEFRRLLLADSRERQAILEVLFQTEIYRIIEEALKQAAREIEASIKDVGRRLQLVLDQAQADSAEQLACELEQARLRSATGRNEIEVLKDREKIAQEQVLEARQVAEKVAEVQRAREDLSILENKIPVFDEKRGLLTMARKAAALEGEEKALERRLREADEATRKLKAAREAADRARASVKTAEERFNRERERRQEREEARRQLSRLEDITAGVKQLDEASKRATQSQERVSVATSVLSAATSTLQECLSRIEQNREALRETEKIAGKLELFRLKSMELEKALHHRTRLVQMNEAESAACENLTEVVARLDRTEQAMTAACGELESLENAWIDGQAAILAEKLAPGIPCPVCGSTEHPARARSEQPLPTERALKSKRTRVNELKDKLDEARGEKAELEKTVSEIRASAEVLMDSLGETAAMGLPELESALDQAKKEHNSASEAQEKLLLLTEEARMLEQALSENKAKRDQADKLRNEAVTAEQIAKAEVITRQNGIPEDLRDMSALNQAKQEAHHTVRMLDEALEKAAADLSDSREVLASCEAALKAAEDSAAQASSSVVNHREEFFRSLRAAGFMDQADFRAAKRVPAEIERMEAETRDFDRSLNTARDRMLRAQEAAEGLVLPDLESLESGLDKIKKGLESALREEAALSEKIKRIDALLADYRRSARDLEALEARYAVVGRISEVASGHNPQGITFQRFVLGALLDDVLIAATERLQIMSHRRYSLQRRAERSDRRTSGGLDLEVLDSYTGMARPVSTLSGGESFLASLALALGLSDVVQAYAGGIHLDTIFVDEGFGSLDPEALDLAFRALVDLQRGGRLVGIISHVPDLRERIDTRLEIIPDRRGSTVRFVIG